MGYFADGHETKNVRGLRHPDRETVIRRLRARIRWLDRRLDQMEEPFGDAVYIMRDELCSLVLVLELYGGTRRRNQPRPKGRSFRDNAAEYATSPVSWVTGRPQAPEPSPG